MPCMAIVPRVLFYTVVKGDYSRNLIPGSQPDHQGVRWYIRASDLGSGLATWAPG